MALSAAVIRYAPGDRVLLGAAPGGSFGSTHWVQALAAGATVVLPASRDAAVVVQTLHATSATHFVSTTLEALSLVRAAGTQSRPESLRWACLAGAMLDPLLIGALRERFTPNLQLHFGTAESGIVAQADAALAAQQPGCAGRLLPWAEAYAAGRGGERLPTGAVGRLCLRSAVAAGAYFGEGAEGARVFPGRGWFASTFAATVTPGGLVHLCTQDAPTVKLGEVVLDATVLERAIRRLPAVRDAGVVALPVAGGQAELVAVVVAADQGSLEGLALHCALQVGRAAVPRRVVLAASLPRAADGRLDRTALQRLAAEGMPAGAPPGTLLS
jgi:long-chain acyl-CoA synthetase